MSYLSPNPALSRPSPNPALSRPSPNPALSPPIIISPNPALSRPSPNPALSPPIIISPNPALSPPTSGNQIRITQLLNDLNYFKSLGFNNKNYASNPSVLATANEYKTLTGIDYFSPSPSPSTRSPPPTSANQARIPQLLNDLNYFKSLGFNNTNYASNPSVLATANEYKTLTGINYFSSKGGYTKKKSRKTRKARKARKSKKSRSRKN